MKLTIVGKFVMYVLTCLLLIALGISPAVAIWFCVGLVLGAIHSEWQKRT